MGDCHTVWYGHHSTCIYVWVNVLLAFTPIPCKHAWGLYNSQTDRWYTSQKAYLAYCCSNNNYAIIKKEVLSVSCKKQLIIVVWERPTYYSANIHSDWLKHCAIYLVLYQPLNRSCVTAYHEIKHWALICRLEELCSKSSYVHACKIQWLCSSIHLNYASPVAWI